MGYPVLPWLLPWAIPFIVAGSFFGYRSKPGEMPFIHFFIGATFLIVLGIATIGSVGGLLFTIGVFVLGLGSAAA